VAFSSAAVVGPWWVAAPNRTGITITRAIEAANREEKRVTAGFYRRTKLSAW